MMSRALLAVTVLMIVGCGADGSTSTPGKSVNGERPVTDFNGVPFGATCSGDSDCGGQVDSCCPGGKCSAAGWCSPKRQSDEDCSSGFFCIAARAERPRGASFPLRGIHDWGKARRTACFRS